MSHDAHDEDAGIGPVIWVVVACIVGALLLVVLALPRATTNFFLALNDSFLGIFESSLFLQLRFVAGIITVALTGFATWLFFKLLEMEKEHENHVYHHTDHTHESEHHTVHVQEHKTEHTPKPQKPVAPTEREADEVYDAMPEAHHVDTQHMEATPNVQANHHMPGVETMQKQSIQEGNTDAYVKTAPPPPHIFKERLPGESGVRGVQIGEDHPGHFQWQSVLRLATSSNPSDWRLAIIEADVILDMMTYIQGFEGNTLGERLKNADPGFFKNVDFARKAHWVRNQIAHEPNIQFTPREINQAIRMYEAAFNEFKYI